MVRPGAGRRAPVVMGIGSMLAAILATVAIVTGSNGSVNPGGSGNQDALIAFIWAAIAAINVAYARRR